MDMFLGEQHAVNGLFRHGENIIIFSHSQQLLLKIRKCSLLCRGNVFSPQQEMFLTQHWASSRLALSSATAWPSELEYSYRGVSAVVVMRNLSWHFSNPVH